MRLITLHLGPIVNLDQVVRIVGDTLHLADGSTAQLDPVTGEAALFRALFEAPTTQELLSRAVRARGGP